MRHILNYSYISYTDEETLLYHYLSYKLLHFYSWVAGARTIKEELLGTTYWKLTNPSLEGKDSKGKEEVIKLYIEAIHIYVIYEI